MAISEEETSLRVKKQTRNKLAALGGKDDTFDDLINHIIDFYNEHKNVVKK